MQLTKIETFKNIDNSLIDEINKVGKIKTFLAGAPAMNCDDTTRYFYIILEGSIKVYHYNPQNNREQTIYLLQQNDMFDILTLLDGNYHEVMTTTLETTKVLEVPIQKVKEWIETKPEFNKAFYPYLAKQLRGVEELAVDLSLYDTSTRLMKLLLKNLNQKTGKLLQKLSHEEIASLIGSVRAVVNRHLQQLKKEGIIDIKRKTIAVNSVDKLLKKVEDEYR